jgi:hypothetical protein
MVLGGWSMVLGGWSRLGVVTAAGEGMVKRLTLCLRRRSCAFLGRKYPSSRSSFLVVLLVAEHTSDLPRGFWKLSGFFRPSLAVSCHVPAL